MKARPQNRIPVFVRNLAEDQPTAPAKALPLWRQIPKLLGRFHASMELDQLEEVWDYEPIHLHLTPCGINPAITAIQGTGIGQSAQKAFSFDDFRFLLSQYPTLRTICFAGSPDPLHHPELLRMIQAAHQLHEVDSTVLTDGSLLGTLADRILNSPLKTLIIRVHSHSPAEYARFSGHPASRFVTLRDHVQALVRRRNALGSSLELNLEMTVDLHLEMTVDLHNYHHMPEMIRCAEDWGVDGLQLENFIPAEPGVISDRTLYTHHKPVVELVESLKAGLAQTSPVAIVLPVLLEADMSHHRHCLDPFTTLAVDALGHVSACTRQLFYQQNTPRITDSTCWSNQHYQWLRSIHNTNAESATPVPYACRRCPRNMPCP